MDIYPRHARDICVGIIESFERYPADPDLWPGEVVQEICDRIHGAAGLVWLLTYFVRLVASQSCPRTLGSDAASAAMGPSRQAGHGVSDAV